MATHRATSTPDNSAARSRVRQDVPGGYSCSGPGRWPTEDVSPGDHRGWKAWSNRYLSCSYTHYSDTAALSNRIAGYDEYVLSCPLTKGPEGVITIKDALDIQNAAFMPTCNSNTGDAQSFSVAGTTSRTATEDGYAFRG
jgi:hypothetical protein